MSKLLSWLVPKAYMSFDPVTLGVSALSGGAAALGRWFGRPQRKPEQVKYEGLRSLTEIPETAGYTEELERRMGQGPEHWRDSFYEDIYQPTAEEVRGNWGEQVQDPIMSAAGAMGAERASPTIDRLAKELTKRELGLATLAGDLRVKGSQFGKGISESARAGLGNYIGAEGATQQRAAMADLGGAQQYEQDLSGFAQRQEQVLPDMLGTGIETAGTVYDLMNPQKSWLDQLMDRTGNKRTAINAPRVATPPSDRYR